jgi:predicted PurR-regulated permease PerM
MASEFNSFKVKISKSLAVLNPFIIGFTIAYLLNFFLKFYEEKILDLKFFKNLKPKSKRGLGLLFTYTTVFLLLYLFFVFVFPQLTASIVGLANDIPRYINDISKSLDNFMNNLNINDEYINIAVEKWNDFVNYTIKFITDLIPMIGNLLKSIASSIWNIILGLIISIYMLIDKEKFFALSKKVTCSLFSKSTADKVFELTHRSNNIFGKFLSGKILDSFIIGILTFIVLSIFKMPYTVLVSFIIGITNIIPFFGPFIGAIPSFFIILFVSPIKSLWFLLIILIIQQIDGNIIGPKILGDSLGISAFWILFSLLVTGKLFGLVGMVIGVPLFTLIYSIIKDIVEGRLKKKGLPSETSDYM